VSVNGNERVANDVAAGHARREPARVRQLGQCGRERDAGGDPDRRLAHRGDERRDPRRFGNLQRGPHTAERLDLENDNVGGFERGKAAGIIERADALVGGDGYVDATPESGEVVEGGDGLLDELEVEACEPPDHRLGRFDVPRTVGVDAQRDGRADRAADRRHELDVGARSVRPTFTFTAGKRSARGIDGPAVDQGVDRHRVAQRRPTVTRRFLGRPPRRDRGAGVPGSGEASPQPSPVRR
jgi:hypothetical protein